MANETRIPSRHVQKHDIEANWIKAGNSTNPFCPMKAEIIVYDSEIDADGNILELPENRKYPYARNRYKIGDGKTSINELPFINQIGLGDNSIQQISNNALSDKTIAMGTNSTAGAKAILIIAPSANLNDTDTINELELESVQGLEIGDVLTIIDSYNYSYPSIAMISTISFEDKKIGLTSLIGTENLKGSDFKRNSDFARHLSYVIPTEVADKVVSNIESATKDALKTYLKSSELDESWDDKMVVVKSGDLYYYAFATGYTTEKGIGVNNIDIDINDISNIAVTLLKYSPEKLSLGSYDIGEGAIAIGLDTVSLGYYSTAFGYKSTANGLWSVAVGQLAKSNGNGSVAVGHHVVAEGLYSSAKGTGSTAIGHSANSQGINTKALNRASSAEGENSIASGRASYAGGYGTEASGDYSTATGRYSKAKGTFSSAEGNNTVAENYAAHSQGTDTHAIGHSSHASGYGTIASGSYSYAGGQYTKATANAQMVIGQYNSENNDALFIVGNGESDTKRKNAFEVLKDGAFNYRNNSDDMVNIKGLDSNVGIIVDNISNIETIEYTGTLFKSPENASFAKINIFNTSNEIVGFKLNSSNLLNMKNATITNDSAFGLNIQVLDTGSVVLNGTYDNSGGYPQFKFKIPSFSFIADRDYSLKADNGCLLILKYKPNKSDASWSYARNETIRWTENSVFQELFIQMPKDAKTYDNVLINPRIYYAEVQGYELFADDIPISASNKISNALEKSWTPYFSKTVSKNDSEIIKFEEDGTLEVIFDNVDNANSSAISAFDLLFFENRDNNAKVLNDKNNLASYPYSLAVGRGTSTSRDNQTVVGEFNADNENALFIVGNGDSEEESNAFTVNKDGTATINSIPKKDMDVSNKGYVDSSKSESKAYTDNARSDVINYANTLNEITNRRIEKLEFVTLSYIEESSVAYEKSIPSGVQSNAFLMSIGGASKASKNYLDPSSLVFSTMFGTTNIPTLNNDGSFTFMVDWGTTNIASSNIIPAGTYRIWCSGTVSEDLSMSLWCDSKHICYVTSESKTKEFTSDKDFRIEIHAALPYDITEVEYVTSKIMIAKAEYGDIPFEPFFEGFKHAKVTAVESLLESNNLLNPNTLEGPCTVNTDGSISYTIQGSNVIGLDFPIERGEYYISFSADKNCIFKLANAASDILIEGDGAFEITEAGTYNIYIENGRWSGDESEVLNATAKIMLNSGTTKLDFEAYFDPKHIGVINIPEAVQNHDGYGREGSYIEWKDDGTITLTVTKDDNLNNLVSPSITDITEYFSEDSDIIKVSNGGILRFSNSEKMGVPSEILYVRRKD